MNKEILNKVTEKLIKPKYPLIEEFEWRYYEFIRKSTPIIKYVLMIKIDESISKMNQREKEKYSTKIGEDVETLFQMLGPEPNEGFWNVTIQDFLYLWL